MADDKIYPIDELRKMINSKNCNSYVINLIVQAILELDKRYKQLDQDIENITGILEIHTDSEGKTLPNALDKLRQQLAFHQHRGDI